MLKEGLTHSVVIIELFKGFLILNVLIFPLTALLTFYITIMGASNPNKPDFLNTLGIVIFFIYGIPLVILLSLIGLGKIFDIVLYFSAINTATVSWFSLILAAIAIVIAGNIFVDNLYQFKQGHYGISFFALVIVIGYLLIVYFSAKIPIRWFSF
ncbi:hypothetical protein [Thioflexithrix psekupsensis]|uniref:Yip1 domain-containing protein n=1 Tax=Thioflexithrix psekupsensis TaxID=1570016 RepID=A0A251X643_9GAMM|nr:hypothetical protein [Thioflexithrix psekupsensis]OUD13108.1 hypothetical protein TPSD3_10690 [Thioflexithrix psekupsensis]